MSRNQTHLPPSGDNTEKATGRTAAMSAAAILTHLRRLGVAERGDHELLNAFAAQRDGEAFAALVRRHGRLVLGVCRRVLGDEHDAEDAFQATFLVLVRRARGLGRGGSVGNWLHTVAYHVALRARANAARRREQERSAPARLCADQFAEMEWHDLRRVVDEELARLPEKYRAPLVLCHLEGKTNEAAARELGWPAGSLSRRMARGCELLRQALARRGV